MIIRSLPSVPLRPQRLRIEHPATLDHPPDGLGILDIFEGIGIEQDHVRELAGLQRGNHWGQVLQYHFLCVLSAFLIALLIVV